MCSFDVIEISRFDSHLYRVTFEKLKYVVNAYMFNIFNII